MPRDIIFRDIHVQTGLRAGRRETDTWVSEPVRLHPVKKCVLKQWSSSELLVERPKNWSSAGMSFLSD